jgi:hypothetical protein
MTSIAKVPHEMTRLGDRDRLADVAIHDAQLTLMDQLREETAPAMATEANSMELTPMID